MVTPFADSPPITAFRSAIGALLRREAEGARRDVVILALDGVPYLTARCLWPQARVAEMRSVFPSSSAPAWLSALTGAGVAEHGVPGVVFRREDGRLVNVYEEQDSLGIPRTGTLFHDAVGLGYGAVAVAGDLETVPGAWRDALLDGARLMTGHRFYTAAAGRPVQDLVAAVDRAVVAALMPEHGGGPRLVWCFVEIDRHIHLHGYDGHVLAFLEGIGRLAMGWAERGRLVVAHSDHGLVPTRHDAELARLLARVPAELGCAGGGAGRTRWFYPPPACEDRLVAALERGLPATVSLCRSDWVFPVGSLAWGRAGRVTAIARGTEFVTFGGQIFDHGSDTDGECAVPFAVWGE